MEPRRTDLWTLPVRAAAWEEAKRYALGTGFGVAVVAAAAGYGAALVVQEEWSESALAQGVGAGVAVLATIVVAWMVLMLWVQHPQLNSARLHIQNLEALRQPPNRTEGVLALGRLHEAIKDLLRGEEAYGAGTDRSPLLSKSSALLELARSAEYHPWRRHFAEVLDELEKEIDRNAPDARSGLIKCVETLLGRVDDALEIERTAQAATAAP